MNNDTNAPRTEQEAPKAAYESPRLERRGGVATQTFSLVS